MLLIFLFMGYIEYARVVLGIYTSMGRSQLFVMEVSYNYANNAISVAQISAVFMWGLLLLLLTQWTRL